jgi:hypothetical protein
VAALESGYHLVGEGNDAKYSPEGRRIADTSASGSVGYGISVKTLGAQRQLRTQPVSGLAWSPDGPAWSWRPATGCYESRCPRAPLPRSTRVLCRSAIRHGRRTGPTSPSPSCPRSGWSARTGRGCARSLRRERQQPPNEEDTGSASSARLPARQIVQLLDDRPVLNGSYGCTAEPLPTFPLP